MMIGKAAKKTTKENIKREKLLLKIKLNTYLLYSL